MEALCDNFWNSSLSWNTTDPHLSQCFQRTILVWIPCIFLWVFAPLQTHYLLHAKNRNIPWSWLNILRCICSAALIIEELIFLFYALLGNSDAAVADYLAPVFLFLSFVLQFIFLLMDRKNGIQRSGYLFIFWLLVLICGIPGFATHIRYAVNGDPESDTVHLVLYMIYYPLVILMAFSYCIADKRPSILAHPRGNKRCPELDSSFPSFLTFAWLDRLIWKGYRKPLVQEDLWDLSYEYSSKKIVKEWDHNWNKSLRKTHKNGKSETRSSFSNKTKEVTLLGIAPNSKHYISILPTMIRTYGLEFLFGASLKLFNDILIFISPQILNLLINFTENKDEHMWRGYLYSIILFLVTQMQSFFLGQYFLNMFLVGLKMRTAIISAVYRKALRMSNAAKKDSTVGEIVNLMSVDAQRFMDLMPYINMLWSAPLQISLALFFLWKILGPSVLAGLAIMILLIPINGVIANKIRGLQMKQMKEKDNRVKLMSEILNGIKVLKLYAWEPSFEEQVVDIRKKEVKVLKKAAYMNAGTSFIWTCTPFMVSLATFAVYVFVSDEALDSRKAFVSIALFDILRFPISMLPMMISGLVQASVSLKRMNKFMNSEELDTTAVERDNPEKTRGDPIQIENGTFSWDKTDENPTLSRINLNIKEGSLVAVVGAVGMGKSSLCSAIIGEMEKTSGTISTSGSICYVPQQAWIQNATLESNILFGKKMNLQLYQKIIDGCALKDDLSILPAGDQTEIGEKGINLSGGQKQRVSLARAVFSDSDMALLDDPLSAVDAHVGKHIFERVIGPEGLLKNKTRLLVTHSLVYLPKMDNIIVLKNGQITEQGTYKELIARKGEFQEFLLEFLAEEQEEKDLDEYEEIVTELEKSMGRKDFVRQISRKRVESECSIDGQSNGTLVRRGSKKISESSHYIEKDKVPQKEEVIGKKLIETETLETGSVSCRVYGYYIKAIGIMATVLTIVFYTLSQLCSVGGKIVLSIWSEDHNSTKTDVRNMYLGIYGGFGIGQAIMIFFGAYAIYYGTFNAGVRLHTTFLSNVMRLPMLFFETNPVGRILNRFSKDLDALDNVLPWMIRSWLMCFYQVIATLGIIVYTTPMFLMAMIPVMIIYYLIQVLYVTTSRQLKRLESVSRSPIYSHYGESIQGAATIRAYNKTQEFILESERRVDYNQIAYYPSVIANRWLGIRLEFLGNILTFFAALFAVMKRDDIDAGLVGLSITYALSVTQTLNWLVRMTSDVETNVVAVERIKEYSETTQEAAWEVPSNKPPKSWPEDGLVKFKEYATRYREGLDLVVKNISFEVMPKEKIGIVGRTGAGKSSLTLALFRIIEPVEGSIIIDGIDISKIGIHDLRGKLTIIPQDPVLFSGTLRMNLDPFNQYADDEIWLSIEHAHLKEYISSLSAGLQHAISEGGENLSVGQRQLVCLARALLRKTKVLVLDEATAAVDLETDSLIQQTIRREFADCTVLTIAHRLNTIMDSTRILVLDRGRIKEFDTPATLLKDRNSIFFGMAKDAGLV